MTMNWQQKRMAILGYTYPSYSSKYREIACTGAILEDTKEIVRLHPIPLRYMSESHRFKTWQWITAEISRHSEDPRKQSYRVKDDSIELGEIWDSRRHGHDRRNLILQSPNIYSSVDQLKDQQKADGTSLGFVKVHMIHDCDVIQKKPKDEEDWKESRKKATAGKFNFEDSMPIDFIDCHFIIKWSSVGDPNNQHAMKLKQWPIHQLYRKYMDSSFEYRKQKVIEAMWKNLNLEKNELFFCLGNLRDRLYNFMLVDTLALPRDQARAKPSVEAQGRLF